MRNFAVLLMTIFIYINSYSQTNVYHNFPSANAIWRENSGGYQCSCCSEYQYFIKGDTLINGLTYIIICKTGKNLEEDFRGFCTQITRDYFKNIYVGAIRENLVERKLYFVPNGYNNDTLLYDFNLKQNDTIPKSFLNHSNDTIYISKVDSILIAGNYRKQFELSTKYQKGYVHIIEGIGSTSGLFGSLEVPFEFGTSLLCFKYNGYTIYPDSSSECNLINNIVKYNYNTKFSINPNPIETKANINISNTNKFDITIIDILGKEFRRLNNLENGGIIDRIGLSSGLYIFRVIQNNKILVQSKVEIK